MPAFLKLANLCLLLMEISIGMAHRLLKIRLKWQENNWWLKLVLSWLKACLNMDLRLLTRTIRAHTRPGAPLRDELLRSFATRMRQFRKYPTGAHGLGVTMDMSQAKVAAAIGDYFVFEMSSSLSRATASLSKSIVYWFNCCYKLSSSLMNRMSLLKYVGEVWKISWSSRRASWRLRSGDR